MRPHQPPAERLGVRLAALTRGPDPRPRVRRQAAMAAAIAVLAGCAAPSLAPGLAPAFAPRFGLAPAAPVPARLAGLGARDWSYGRIAAAPIAAARAAAEAAAKATPPRRRLQAFGDDGGWRQNGMAGLPLSAFGVTGVAAGAPAWAYRCPDPRLVGRVWFVTTTGWLVGLHRDVPLGTTANQQAIKIDLGHPVTRGAVSLSDDGLRAYLVTDDGHCLAVSLDTATVQDYDMGGPAVGMAACVDPVLSEPVSPAGNDVVFAGRNDGRIFKLRWNGGLWAPAAAPAMGVTATRALDGDPAKLLSVLMIACNGRLYYGDRAGNFVTTDWRGATPVVASTALPGLGPIEVACSLKLDDDLANATDVFVPAGVRLAWHHVESAGRPGWTAVSPALVVDGAPGAEPEGALAGYPLRGLRVADRPADEAFTADPLAPAPREVATDAVGGGRPGWVQWRLGGAFAGKSFLEATVRLTARHAPTDLLRPDVLLAAGGAWTADTARDDDLPTWDDTARAGFDALPATPWRTNVGYGWTLPAERLPAGGPIALTVRPAGASADPVDFHGLADAARAPRLDAFASDYAVDGGLASPPMIGGESDVLYVVNANALFRLPLATPEAFAGGVRYAATRLGRLPDGPLDPGRQPMRFVTNPTAPVLTATEQIYALELRRGDAGSWNFGVAHFDGPGSHLVASHAIDGVAATDQTYRAGTFAACDSFGNDFGALYFGLGDGRLYRVGL